jgi:hypothetical protein
VGFHDSNLAFAAMARRAQTRQKTSQNTPKPAKMGHCSFLYQNIAYRETAAAAGGVFYLVLNRGNRQMGVFREPGDYLAFLPLLQQGKEKAQIELSASA